MKWKVDYDSFVKIELDLQMRNGTLTKSDLEALLKWVKQIELFGPESVQTDFWNDHPLDSEWRGYRSASFSLRGRLLYRVENTRLVVMVVRVTARHNYRK